MNKIVLEDFNEGDGYFKVNLAYLTKEQVEEIESLVSKWNPTDEDIKNCIRMCLTDANDQRFKDYGTNLQECLTWLEKQCSQNNTEDEDILHRFCFYSYKDESNILYLSGLYVNVECRNKGIGTKILEVADEVAKSLNCNAIRLKTEIGSNAERLYRRNGYNTFKREGNNVWLEKQCEKKPTDDIQKPIDIKIHQGDKNNPYDMSFEEAQNYITKRDFDICCTDYAVYVDDRYIIQTIANLLRWADDNPKQLNNKVEPKFKVGNWITNGQLTCKVLGITCKSYELHLHNDDYCHFETDIQSVDKHYHLWTIEDAKDGDVLAWDDSKCIALFKNIYDEDSFNSHGFVGHCTGTFESRLSYHDIEGTHPANEEQYDLLFKKMKDAGYEWDDKKRELKKIESFPNSAKTGKNWSVGDEELMRHCYDALDVASYHSITKEDKEELIEWIKSLKQRIKE